MTDQPASPPIDDSETVASSYAPTPERRPEWARSAWLEPTPPAPVEPAVVEPVRAAPRSGGAGIGSIVGAAVLSAVLASGGTVLLLGAT
ncbi:MAG TPA: hypothetical protein VFR14_12030, partial [Candidatus Limnocylindrales bacterium]|nr:hypothetical protein [Candidatus Limnocylindrales bacterium]